VSRPRHCPALITTAYGGAANAVPSLELGLGGGEGLVVAVSNAASPVCATCRVPPRSAVPVARVACCRACACVLGGGKNWYPA